MKRISLSLDNQLQLIQILELGNAQGYNIRELRQLNGIIDKIQEAAGGEDFSLEDAEHDLLTKIWNKVQLRGNSEARRAALEIDKAIAEATG